MRIALVHNQSAGSENHAAHDLEACLRRNGHEVVEIVAKPEQLLDALSADVCDVVAVAGGDGTVGGTACAVSGMGIPLAILPLGTANNTARTLRVEGDLDALVRTWHREHLRDFDLATFTYDGGGRQKFAEAFGWGVFPEVIARVHETFQPEQPARALLQDRQLFREVVERAAPRPYELDIDGETIRGDFLLVEIVNIPFIGPQLELSPESDPSDGKLELVLAGESERAQLVELAQGGPGEGRRKLPTRSLTRVTVRSEAGSFHRDGQLVELTPRAREYAIAIQPASVRYLVAGE